MNAKHLPRLHPESLAARVVGFFALNPDEALSVGDIVAKFVDPNDSRNVHTQLMAALSNGLLAWSPALGLYSKGAVDMPSLAARAPKEREQPKRPEKRQPVAAVAAVDPVDAYLAGRLSMRAECVSVLRAALQRRRIAHQMAAKLLEVQA